MPVCWKSENEDLRLSSTMKHSTDSFYGRTPADSGKRVISGLRIIGGITPHIAGVAMRLHPHADLFFRLLLKTPPDRFNLYLFHPQAECIPSQALISLDLREALIALNRIGFSIYVRTGPVERMEAVGQFVTISRRYDKTSFGEVLNFPQSIGLPAPTLVQTRGDGLLRFIYKIEMSDSHSPGESEQALIQSNLDLLMGIADLDPDPFGKLAVSGFSAGLGHRGRSAQVRTIYATYQPVSGSLLLQSLITSLGDLALCVRRRSSMSPCLPSTPQGFIDSAKALSSRIDLDSPAVANLFMISCWIASRQFPDSILQPSEIPHLIGRPDLGVAWWPSVRLASAKDRPQCEFFLNLLHLYALSLDPPVDLIPSDEGTDIDCFVCDEDDYKSPGLEDAPDNRVCLLDEVSSIVQQGKDDASMLRQFAKKIAADHDASPLDLPQFLKSFARTLKTKFDGSYLETILKEALLFASGSKDPLTPSDVLTLREVPWLWETIFLEGALNLVVAQPKLGKTSLVLAFLAALLRGDSELLGCALTPGSRKVLIVGTDQPESDWIRMLTDAGLVTDSQHLHSSIVALYTAANSLYLDVNGFNAIESFVRDNPGIIVVIDSLAACTLPLGIDENSQAIGVPIGQLMNKLASYSATTILIHHSGKASSSESPTAISRGSSAIPAVASQIVSLRRAYSDSNQNKESRILLETEGRAGRPTKRVIQRTKDGWICQGEAAQVSMQDQRLSVLKGLNERQRAVFQLIERRWLRSELTSTADVIRLSVDTLDGKDQERAVRSTFAQLKNKGLIEQAGDNPPSWRPAPLQ